MDIKKDIAVLLHSTFTRWEYARKTIDSFLVAGFKVYFSYTGELDLEKLEFMDMLRQGGHECYYLGWDTSPAITRNFLIDRITEPYVFKVDDDFIYDYDEKEFELDKTIKLLEDKKGIGLVGFSVYSRKYVSPFLYDVVREGKNIKFNKPPEAEMDHGGLKYRIVDITPDCWIAKREIFPACNYDEQYHVSQGLHPDFFMNIKYNTFWKVAYVKSNKIYTFKHDEGWEKSDVDRKNSFYNKKRFRYLNTPKNGNDLIFLPKWGADKIIK
jgi:hypothetical protein